MIITKGDVDINTGEGHLHVNLTDEQFWDITTTSYGTGVVLVSQNKEGLTLRLSGTEALELMRTLNKALRTI